MPLWALERSRYSRDVEVKIFFVMATQICIASERCMHEDSLEMTEKSGKK